MIAASLEAFRAAGFTHAALAVDSDNPTGAYRIYERLGYQRMHRSVVYQRQVDSATVASK
jgi:ribosomal protein S18 acetylase RimI-like enzyme